MKLRDISRYVGVPSRIITTLWILLIALAVVQTVAYEITRSLSYFRTPQASQVPQPEYTRQEKEQLRVIYAAKRFLPDGTLHIITGPQYSPGRLDKPAADQVYDVNNNLLWEGQSKDNPYEYIAFRTGHNRDLFSELDMRRTQQLSPDSSQFLEIPVRSSDETQRIWRYIPHRRLFAGYSAGGGNSGYAGPAGFADSRGDSGSFADFKAFLAYCPPDSYSPTLLWQTNRAVHEIDFEHRKVDTLLKYEAAKIEPMAIHNWGPYAGSADRYNRTNMQSATVDVSTYRPLLYCKDSAGAYHVAVREPNQTRTVNIPAEWRPDVHNTCDFAAPKDRILMQRQWFENTHAPHAEPGSKEWEQYFLKPRRQGIELYEVGPTGVITLLNQFTWRADAAYQRKLSRITPAPEAREHITTLSPPLYDLLYQAFTTTVLELGLQRNNELLRILVQTIYHLCPRYAVFNWLLSVVLTAVVFLHCRPRRTSNAQVIFWLVLTMLFGLAGLLTYLALNYTPAIKCPACRRRRGLKTSNCPNCGAALPGPPPGRFDAVLKV